MAFGNSIVPLFQQAAAVSPAASLTPASKSKLLADMMAMPQPKTPQSWGEGLANALNMGLKGYLDTRSLRQGELDKQAKANALADALFGKPDPNSPNVADPRHDQIATLLANDQIPASALAPMLSTKLGLAPPEYQYVPQDDGSILRINKANGSVDNVYQGNQTKPPTVHTFFDEKTGQDVEKQWNPKTGTWDQAGGVKKPASVAGAPTVHTFYDDKTGQEYEAQYNPATGQWDRIGGNKQPAPATITPQLTDIADPNDPTGQRNVKAYVYPDGRKPVVVADVPNPVEWRDATPDEIAAAHLPVNTLLQINKKTGEKRVPSGLGGGLGGLPSQDDVTAISESIARGDTPPTSISKNSRYNAPVIADLSRKGIDLSQLVTDWNATQRHYATLNNPQQTRIRQNIDTLQHTLPTIRQLAEAWNAGGFPILNAANRTAAMNGVYGPEANKIVTLLGQQTADVVAEISSVLMGGNAPTDHAMELAAQNLSADWSYPTMIAALDQLERNITFRRNAIENVSTAGVANSLYNYQQTDQAQPAPPEPPRAASGSGLGAGSPTVDDLIKKYAP